MTDFRQRPYNFLNALFCQSPEGQRAKIREHVASDVVWEVNYPIESLHGHQEVHAQFYEPLQRAFTNIQRRDMIFIGGVTSNEGDSDWCAALGHYVGVFDQPYLGIAPTNLLVFLRYGEFYRVENDQIVEAKIIIDLVDLLRQCGRMPVPGMGAEMTFPVPATMDGILPQNPGASEQSRLLVHNMLRDLMVFDPVTFHSVNQFGPDGYWSDSMLWYGPGGIGSNYTVPGFIKDHRKPFLTGFPDRIGGLKLPNNPLRKNGHYALFGDSNYVASGGWPSLIAHHRAPYNGIPAEDKEVLMRVMDFWRAENGKLIENWVLIDMVDLFRQMGVDVLARAAEL
ncbi:MAG: ester cyclase [Alphaproteobacteria bacterium]|nr:ester cyclase [Alphaproteobacteria bacterium]